MRFSVSFLALLCLLCCWGGLVTFSGCANITAPTGGYKDTIPPKLVYIDPADSQLNSKTKKISLYFDKYINVADASREVQLSPIIPINPTVRGINKEVIVKIVDTLLEDNTTYRLSFGSSIRDVHEGNVFKNYVYTFSTGPYFDSLALSGKVISAVTGLPDTGSVWVVLYYAKDGDSAVVKRRPKYVAKADGTGKFVFKGLPRRVFNVYALKDPNNNLIYDGPGEQIAFIDRTVTPGDTAAPPINLRLFAEVADTAVVKPKIDSFVAANKARNKKPEDPKYSVNLDTINVTRRTFDINGCMKITFNKQALLNREKMKLSYDSLGTDIPVPVAMFFDTVKPNELRMLPREDSIHPKVLHNAKLGWRENTTYTLRLSKGYAKDTAGTEFFPGRFTFHTMQDEDYGKVTIHLPTRYYSEIEQENKDSKKGARDSLPDFVLLVTTDKDTTYQQKVTDTMVTLTRLSPMKYTIRVIVDKNKNGKWDTGDLLGKKQPEEVVPYKEPLSVKPGWEYTVDFDDRPEPKDDYYGK